MNDRFRTLQIGISGFLVVAAVGLIAVELRQPGFCPNYPFLDVPACWIMGLFFFWMFISNFVETRLIREQIFFSSTFLALASSSFFSTQQFLGVGYCPIVFGIPIPLCYTVPPIIILSIYLKAFAAEQHHSKPED